MANPSKRKGTAAETAVVEYLRSRGWPHAERRALAGRSDKGDIAGIPGIVIEVKSTKSTDLAGWVNEANSEGFNDGGSHGVVWRKAPGTSHVGRWHVIMDGETFATLLKEAGY